MIFIDFYWNIGPFANILVRHVSTKIFVSNTCHACEDFGLIINHCTIALSIVYTQTPLWTSGTKCLYCVSNLSNLGLKLLKKISILSQTCLGQNVSIWSQFETFLTFEIQLRLSLFESNLRHFSALSKKCQKGLKNVSKRDLGGFSGWTVFSGT